MNSASRDATPRYLVGLIGRGIGASRSPRMHEVEGDAQGLRLVYKRFDFSALGLDHKDLPRVLAALELAGFAGTNVTHPFKQAVADELDELSDEAARIGAVNTVLFSGGKRIGHNTDVTGFGQAFREQRADAATNDVVQIGAGGGGSAVAHALLANGIGTLTIHDAAQTRAEALAESLTSHYPGATVAAGTAEPAAIAADLAAADGLVNATPMGMAEHPGMSAPETALHAGLWVADIVYFPLETALLAAARRAGCRVMNGSGMAILQAAGAFEIFTGRPADAERMRATFESFD